MMRVTIGGVIVAVVFGTLSPAEIAARAGSVPPGVVAPAGAGRSTGVPGGNTGWAARFARVQLKNGTALHYAEQGPAGGRTVVMLHGLGDSWFSFSRVMPLLPDDVRVIALDQRGHGRSDRPTRYAIPDFAGDVLELMDRLHVGQATIVGHSMGGFVARAVAARAPHRVSGLVVIGGAPVGRNEGLSALKRELMTMSTVDEAFVRAFQESCIARPVPADFMRRVISESLLLPADVWKAAIAGLMDYTPAPQPIRARTLILGGELDSVFSVAEQRALARAIPGAAIHLSPGVGHTPHWEEPKEFASRLVAFLTSVRSE